MNKPLLIGIVGHARAGKDTAVDGYFQETNLSIPTFRLAIADSIRTQAYAMGFTEEQCLSADLKQVKDPVLGISPREALQGIGSSFRATFGKDIFLKMLEKQITNLYSQRPNDIIIFITDIRMPIEAAMIKSHDGILVKIENSKLDLTLPMYQHETEILVDSIETDYTIINDMSLPITEYKCLAALMIRKIIDAKLGRVKNVL